ncbi:acyl-CoA synthetase (AMP-forming)/AMP-acid ligase II [Schinkia azotoformans MEV2011]|uniref:Acyl-CoA synthetase (AMP-forming)/AMP-acid ligase II n=1 Tax=Schinkia azotoformans MEV2011 TaxID=1348973 RepID=A0A072NN29_SCHAZ|nr:AMP-binding protein [Schinkia azotoformans]KEF38876.1 acyl-CoA synthetase (AMP-forming)/AMP-acid ligase II [Schinkia azotoformans MEV2011]MEC1696779.1 AMP-binding protein [Schinkia azotoformans]MEC1725012.1 AMP-binding protein [Schinkia azotoformans]MEC1741753.1 AMP-binding protein [Schinkia azotoformans]MEC1766569.1 AMP-binding protein [Schinkia azotoformans]
MFLGIDRQDPQKIAAIDDTGKEISYGELRDFALEFGSVVPGRSVIFCLCENTIGALSGYIGCLSNRIVPLLIGATIDRKLLANLIEVYTPAYMWMPGWFVSEFNLPIKYQAYGYALVKTNYELYSINSDLSMLLTTSGSTGSPKLVRHNYRNIEENAKNVAAFFGWTNEERAVCDLPLQYTMGLNVINSHLYVGATVLLTTHNLMSPEFWKYIKDQRGTNFTGVPFSYEVLFKLRFARMDLPHLTTLASGGGKLTDAVFTELANYANRTRKRFFSTYGTTETSARLAFLPPERAVDKIGSIGQAIPGGEIFLLDENGDRILKTEAEGELGYRGPNVTMGYANCRDDLKLGDEWLGEYHTGDVAKRDSEGFYYIIGRKKRFLKLYGLRVSLDMCERLIKEEFKVDCVCTGTDKKMLIYITDEKYKEDVHGFISNKTGIIKSAFSVNSVGTIPRNESGKVQYDQLLQK